MVNRYGLAVNVRPENVALERTRGLRLATIDDLDAAGRERSEFAMRFVQGFDHRGLDCPVVVRGAGPSASAPAPDGSLSIWINPRALAFTGGYALALDTAYWTSGNWAAIREEAQGAFAPEAGCANAPGEAHLFGLPIVSDRSNRTRLEMRIRAAIVNCHISAIAGLLVARYITSGPVILTGCDLSGSDGRRTYEERQLPMFERALPEIEGVYAHPQLTGPLTGLLPEWSES